MYLAELVVFNTPALQEEVTTVEPLWSGGKVLAGDDDGEVVGQRAGSVSLRTSPESGCRVP